MSVLEIVAGVHRDIAPPLATLTLEERHETLAVRARWLGKAGQLENGAAHVEQVDALAHAARPRHSRVVDQQRHAQDLVVHDVLVSHHVVLAERFAVVGGEHEQQIVVPDTARLQVRDDPRERIIDPAHLGVIATPPLFLQVVVARRWRMVRIHVVDPDEEAIFGVLVDPAEEIGLGGGERNLVLAVHHHLGRFREDRIEPAAEAHLFLEQHRVAVERRRREAGVAEDLGDRRPLRRDAGLVGVHPHLAREPAGEERRQRRHRPRCEGRGAIEHDRILRPRIEVRRGRHSAITVHTEPVGAQRVDREQDDALGAPRRRFLRLVEPRQNCDGTSGDGKQCDDKPAKCHRGLAADPVQSPVRLASSLMRG